MSIMRWKAQLMSFGLNVASNAEVTLEFRGKEYSCPGEAPHISFQRRQHKVGLVS